jgi:polyhydroxyalkanoate synthase subunit PhaC
VHKRGLPRLFQVEEEYRDRLRDKTRYQVVKECPEDPAEWPRRAETCQGSWWPDYADWLAERCGEEKAVPAELGGGGLAPICDAPGTYVYDH